MSKATTSEKYLTGKALEKKENEIARSFLTSEQEDLLEYMLKKTKRQYSVTDLLKMYTADSGESFGKVSGLFRNYMGGEVRGLYYKIANVAPSGQGTNKKNVHNPETLKKAVEMVFKGYSGTHAGRKYGISQPAVSYAYRAEEKRRVVEAALVKFRESNELLNPNPKKSQDKNTEKHKKVIREAVDKACNDSLERLEAPKAKAQSNTSNPANTIKASKLIKTVESVQEQMEKRIDALQKEIALEFKKLSQTKDEPQKGHKVGMDSGGNIVMIEASNLKYDEKKVNKMLAHVENLEADLKTSHSQYLGALKDSQVLQKELEDAKIKYATLASDEADLQDFIKDIQAINQAFGEQVDDLKKSSSYLKSSKIRSDDRNIELGKQISDLKKQIENYINEKIGLTDLISKESALKEQLQRANKMMRKDVEEAKDIEHKLKKQLSLSESNKIQAHKDINELQEGAKRYRIDAYDMNCKNNNLTDEKHKLEGYLRIKEQLVQNLQEDNEKLQLDSVNLENKSKNDELRIQSLTVSNKELREVLDIRNEEHINEMAELLEDTAYSESQYREEIEFERNTAKNQIDLKQDHIANLLTEIAANEAEIKNINAAHEELTGKMSNTINDYRDNNDVLTEKLNEDEIYTQSLLEDKEELLTENSALKRECAEHCSEIKELVEDAAYSESELRAAQEQAGLKQNQNKTLIEIIAARDNIIIGRDAIIAAKESEIEDLHNVNNSLEEHTAELYNDIEHNSMDYSNLEEGYKELNSLLQEQYDNASDALKVKGEVLNDLREAQDKIEQLESFNSTVESDNIELQNHNSKLLNEHSELARDLVEVTQQLEEAKKSAETARVELMESESSNYDQKSRGFMSRMFGSRE